MNEHGDVIDVAQPEHADSDTLIGQWWFIDDKLMVSSSKCAGLWSSTIYDLSDAANPKWKGYVPGGESLARAKEIVYAWVALVNDDSER